MSAADIREKCGEPDAVTSETVEVRGPGPIRGVRRKGRNFDYRAMDVSTGHAGAADGGDDRGWEGEERFAGGVKGIDRRGAAGAR